MSCCQTHPRLRGIKVFLVSVARARVRASLRSFLVYPLTVILVCIGTTFALHGPAAARAGKPQTPVAPAGRGPVDRPLPANVTPNHGYPKGIRPPVLPPGMATAGPQRKLSAAEWASVPKPSSTRSATGAVVASGAGAVNLILRPGFAFNDTSLVLYFDAADPGISGWQSWKATVYDPDNGAAQDSRLLQPSEAELCQVPAKYCHSFGAEHGWSLVGGKSYYATITVTFPDGTQAVSPASAQAAARTTSDPPAVPAAQAAGCGCGNVLSPTPMAQVIRGSGVNTATGTYTLMWPDLQLAGYGVRFSSMRTYSSANTAAGRFGIGWTWSYDIKVIPPAAGQTAVTVRAEDGAQAVYTAGTGGAYNRPPGVRSNLSAVSGGGWKLVTPKQTAYTFDAGGRLVSVLDSRGNGVRLAYASNAITLTDAAGRVVTATLNAAGLITKLALPDRRNVIYKYTNGLLTSVQDAESNTWLFGYTSQLLTTVVDPKGRTQLTNTYAGGRVTRQVNASGAATTFEWDASKQESKTIDADGVVSYDGYRGNTLVYSQNGGGFTSHRRYDQLVNPNLLVDPQGNQTTGGSDGAGNVLSVTAPEPFNFSMSNVYDANNNVTSHTNARGHATLMGYSTTNELESIKSATGDTKSMIYDSRGLLTKITDPRGKITTMTYDAAGNLLTRTNPLGEVTTYTYDGSGRRLSTVDPRGNVPGARPLDFTTLYGYDNLDRMTSLWQPRKAHASTTTYDNVGQMIATADPLGHTTSYTYTPVIGRTATVTDANLGVISYTYTAAGRRASVTDQVGGKTTTTYNNRGDVATVVSPRGNVPGANPADFTTTYVYDRNGNLLRTSHPYPGGGTANRDTGYDQLDRAVSSTDPLGRTSVNGYDNTGNVISTADPLGHTTTYTYDPNGRLTAMTAPEGGSDSSTYDAAGNVTRSTSATGGVTTYTYDDLNRVASMVDPRGNAPGANPADYTVSYGYDPAGNLTRVTDQLGQATTFVYDSNSRTTNRTDANGHSVTYKYLDDDTLQSVVGPDGNTQLATVYSYDNLGNVVSRTDALGNIRYTYDKRNRVIDIKDPQNRDTLYSYDAEGNLTQTVAPGDTEVGTRTIAYAYDTLNRRTSMNQAAGALVYNYGYDAKDQLTSLADPAGIRTQEYDNAGRLISVSRDNKTFTYGYDSNGNVRSRTWPDGTTVTSTFNAANQLSTLSVAGGQAGSAAQYTFEYDPSGRLSKTTYPTANHLVTDRAYDRAGRLSDLHSRNDSGTVARYQLTRDPVGNPTGITTTRGSSSQHVAYTYDLFDRLTAACVGVDCGAAATGKIAYSYDQIGNRLSQVLSGSAGNSQTTYTYDSASQLTGSTITTPGGTTPVTYAYDRLGNLVQAGPDTFAYNLDHTIASATVGGSTTTYGYDGQGIQISATTTGGAAQTRAWQTDVNHAPPQLATESITTTGGTTSRGFLSTPGSIPLGLLTGGQTNSYALDTTDGVANVVDPAGSTLAAYDYEPFGTPRSDGTAAGIPNSIANPIRFAGGYQDTTLGPRYSTLARVYDPTAGRYHGVDPVAQSFNEPAVSPYVYVADRPTVSRDPSGAIPACSDVNMYSATCEDYRLRLRPSQPVIDRPPPNIWAPPKTDPWREVKIWGKRTWGLGLSIGLLMMLGGDSAPDVEFYDFDKTERDNRERRDCLDRDGPPDPRFPFYYPLDNDGRAQGAEACLGPWTKPYGYKDLGIELPDDVPAWRPGNVVHKAHLLADRFGGHPIRPNLVTFYQWANLSQMTMVENTVEAMLGPGRVNRLYFQAIPVYTKAYHPRHQELGDAPLYVKYHIQSKNGPPFNLTAQNLA